MRVWLTAHASVKAIPSTAASAWLAFGLAVADVLLIQKKQIFADCVLILAGQVFILIPSNVQANASKGLVSRVFGKIDGCRWI